MQPAPLLRPTSAPHLCQQEWASAFAVSVGAGRSAVPDTLGLPLPTAARPRRGGPQRTEAQGPPASQASQPRGVGARVPEAPCTLAGPAPPPGGLAHERVRPGACGTGPSAVPSCRRPSGLPHPRPRWPPGLRVPSPRPRPPSAKALCASGLWLELVSARSRVAGCQQAPTATRPAAPPRSSIRAQRRWRPGRSRLTWSGRRLLLRAVFPAVRLAVSTAAARVGETGLAISVLCTGSLGTLGHSLQSGGTHHQGRTADIPALAFPVACGGRVTPAVRERAVTVLRSDG